MGFLWSGRFAGFVQVEAWDDGSVGGFGGGARFFNEQLGDELVVTVYAKGHYGDEPLDEVIYGGHAFKGSMIAIDGDPSFFKIVPQLFLDTGQPDGHVLL